MYLPHCGTIKINQHPLVGIHVEGHGVFDAFHKILVLRAYECISSISSINVEPSTNFLTHGTFKNRGIISGLPIIFPTVPIFLIIVILTFEK